MTSLPAALLLDLDGTCVDSEAIWEQVERRYVESHGGVLTPDMRRIMVGAPMWLTVRTIAEAVGQDIDEQAVDNELVTGVAGHMRTHGVPWIPGVRELMARMHEGGVPIGLVTASNSRVATVVAESAAEYGVPFTVMVTGSDPVATKPDPAPYVEAARRLGVPIGQCVAVEDSVTGAASASASGAHTVVIPRFVDIEPLPGVSRLRSVEDLSDEVVARLCEGEIIDHFGGETALAPLAIRS